MKPTLTRRDAWKIVRRWERHFARRKLEAVERERLMVDTLLFVVNKQRQSRVSWGALKKAIMGFRATGPFTVDDLMVSSLPIGVTRKSLVSDLDSLCRRGFLRCVESSVRGRVGSPKVYVIDNKA